MSKPYIGQIVTCVIVAGKSNGHTQQPAIVTNVWSDSCVNIKVIPDCGDLFDATSVRYAPEGPEPNSKLGHDCWPAS